MSTYTKTTNFAAKDSLPSGDPSKIIYGTDIDTEFNNISTAIDGNDSAISTEVTNRTNGDNSLNTAKADKVTSPITGHVAGLDSSGNLTDAGYSPADLLSRANHTGTQSYTTITGLGSLATASNVGQAQIRSAYATYSVAGGTGSWNTSVQVNAGGDWSFTLQRYYQGNSGGSAYAVEGQYDYTASTGAQVLAANNGAYQNRLCIGANGSSSYMYARSRYVSASPPYDLGDGNVPLFIYAVVDTNGDVIATWVAVDPPWAYNGANKINPLDISTDSKGTQFIEQLDVPSTVRGQSMSTIMKSSALRTDYINFVKAPTKSKVPFTQQLKNANMDNVPHPFIDIKSGNGLSTSIILLDTTSDITHELAAIHTTGESVSEIIHSGFIKIDNTALTKKTPSGVKAYGISWK